MILTGRDKTLMRNCIQKYLFLIKEYELVKEKKHPQYRYAVELFRATNTKRQSFMKFYSRFKQSGSERDLLPRKRGPKWKTRRPLPFIEQKVVELRKKGMNRYEIVHTLKPKLKRFTPSPSGVYNIIKRHGLNRLTPVMKKNKRAIIKKKAGELGHIDCHYLSKNIIKGENKRYYLVLVIDSCTRIAWAEVVDDLKSLTVMFAVLKCLNILADHYDIRYKEVLTDNGREFKPPHVKSNKAEHPFERMLMELEIKHRYTRPHRPQTNGKAERFWRTIEDDLFSETVFDSLDEVKEELLQYLYYYNHERPHQGIGGITPAELNEKCQRIT